MKEYLPEVSQFYFLTLVKQIEEHERLIKVYEKYKKLVEEEQIESKVQIN